MENLRSPRAGNASGEDDLLTETERMFLASVPRAWEGIFETLQLPSAPSASGSAPSHTKKTLTQENGWEEALRKGLAEVCQEACRELAARLDQLCSSLLRSMLMQHQQHKNNASASLASKTKQASSPLNEANTELERLRREVARLKDENARLARENNKKKINERKEKNVEERVNAKVRKLLKERRKQETLAQLSNTVTLDVRGHIYEIELGNLIEGLYPSLPFNNKPSSSTSELAKMFSWEGLKFDKNHQLLNNKTVYIDRKRGELWGFIVEYFKNGGRWGIIPEDTFVRQGLRKEAQWLQLPLPAELEPTEVNASSPSSSSSENEDRKKVEKKENGKRKHRRRLVKSWLLEGETTEAKSVEGVFQEVASDKESELVARLLQPSTEVAQGVNERPAPQTKQKAEPPAPTSHAARRRKGTLVLQIDDSDLFAP
ncbi:hypothetical protein QOT17_005935 [Balamuthia mandrillaris]